jgi:phosphoribosylglycinamide formyltransferase-1
MNLGVLASHERTTLQSVLDAFAGGRIPGRVSVVVSNNGDSGTLIKAREAGVQAVHLSSRTHRDPATLDAAILDVLVAAAVDVVFLAGYMKRLGPSYSELSKEESSTLIRHSFRDSVGVGCTGIACSRRCLRPVRRNLAFRFILSIRVRHRPIVRQCKVPVLRDDSVDDLKARVWAREKEFVVEMLAGIAAGDIRLGL